MDEHLVHIVSPDAGVRIMLRGGLTPSERQDVAKASAASGTRHWRLDSR
ncbi:hypothetical protein ABRQ00_09175 [Pectobacterium aroidearum]|uniref:Uncharacterized protein n=1 Tax=Pectobacterium aroidearum TaxID=1201031 RepID=A0AAW3T008_9GAMM|nr:MULTISPECIES: hypothetical protein [Pectobacterium]MBA5204263.1 hypothetical protein [Pectobacterium aroidearum]MDG0798974.1 hypothetical protein [Pectobacterium punjabense]